MMDECIRENKIILYDLYLIFNPGRKSLVGVAENLGVSKKELGFDYPLISNWFDIPNDVWNKIQLQILVLLPIYIKLIKIQFLNEESSKIMITYSIHQGLKDEIHEVNVRIKYRVHEGSASTAQLNYVSAVDDQVIFATLTIIEEDKFDSVEIDFISNSNSEIIYTDVIQSEMIYRDAQHSGPNNPIEFLDSLGDIDKFEEPRLTLVTNNIDIREAHISKSVISAGSDNKVNYIDNTKTIDLTITEDIRTLESFIASLDEEKRYECENLLKRFIEQYKKDDKNKKILDELWRNLKSKISPIIVSIGPSAATRMATTAVERIGNWLGLS